MLHLTWLQKEVKSEWEKQVKKNRTERGKENWRINKILVGMKCSAPNSSTEPMFNNHFIKNYYISSSCPFTLEFLCERRSNALPTQWVLGNAGWDEGEQHPNFHQRPKQPFKFKSGKTQLILEAWCGPSTPLISILPIKLQCQMPLWSCRLWFHYPAEGWGEHRVDCPFSMAFPLCFSSRGFSLAWVAPLPAGGRESLSWFFWVVQNAGLAFQVPFVWKVVGIFTALLEEGGNADFSFQSQEATCSHNCCLTLHSLVVLKFRVRESAGQPHPCPALYFCAPL